MKKCKVFVYNLEKRNICDWALLARVVLIACCALTIPACGETEQQTKNSTQQEGSSENQRVFSSADMTKGKRRSFGYSLLLIGTASEIQGCHPKLVVVDYIGQEDAYMQ